MFSPAFALLDLTKLYVGNRTDGLSNTATSVFSWLLPAPAIPAILENTGLFDISWDKRPALSELLFSRTIWNCPSHTGLVVKA